MSMSHQDRQSALVEEVSRCAAENQFAEAVLAVGAHHQHIRGLAHGGAEERFTDGYRAKRVGVLVDLHAMLGEIGRKVGRWRFRLVFLFDSDRGYRFCTLEKG